MRDRHASVSILAPGTCAGLQPCCRTPAIHGMVTCNRSCISCCKIQDPLATKLGCTANGCELRDFDPCRFGCRT
jgi:hypothetical protein